MEFPQTIPTDEDNGLSTEVLADMAMRARTLYERRQSDAVYDGGDPAKMEQRLAAWCQSAANGKQADFVRRLELEGLDQAAARSLLGAAHAGGSMSLPAWTLTLNDALHHARSHWNQSRLARRLNTASVAHYPFYELLLPLVDYAGRRLAERVGGRNGLLTDTALAPAERALLYLLCGHCAFVLNLEFTIYKASQSSSLGRLLEQSRSSQAGTLYQAFVESFRNGRYKTLFREYAVLARQVATAIDHWVDAMTEFVARLRADHEALAATFNDGKPMGVANKLEYGGSDRHNGARTTIFASFANGPRLVYKPKSLDTDVAVADLFDRINTSGELLRLKTPRVLARQGYGWQAWVEHTACADSEAARRFYIRSGYLLCLVYALEGYDCHHENLVAGGEYPYLIDTETIFNPYKELDAISSEKANASIIAGKEVYYSVIRTGMLPNWSMPLAGQKKDTSGFGGGSVAGNDPVSRLRWVDVATDNMRLESLSEDVETLSNLPFIEKGHTVPADVNADYIVDGFQQMYAFLIRHRDTVRTIIDGWRDMHVRFVRQATRIYSNLVWELAKPEYLRDAADWHIGFETLSRNFLAAERNFPQQAGVWRLLEAEAQALMELDIPYFKVKTVALDVEDGRGEPVVRGYFHQHCHQRLMAKLDGLNSRDEALQVRYINYAFYARAAHSFHAQHNTCDTAATPTGNLTPVTSEECIAIARDIGDELLTQAVRAPDGSIAWIALEYIKEMDAFQFKPISYNLYSGTIGIALFLAALYRVTGEAKYRDGCRAACVPILQVMDKELDSLIRYTGIGGGVGAGSLVYGLASIGDFLGDPALLEAAGTCAAGIDQDQISRDDKHDLIFGTAGCLLGLLKLHALTGEQTILDQARLCGEHLLAARREQDGGQLVPTLSGSVVTGLSHGAAGVALAFMRLYHVSGDQRYHDAAMEHVAFEEELYDPALNNYPDYRSRPGEPAVMTTWCHGAPGIGLSRIALYHVHPDAALREQIERDMAVADAFPLEHLDHICCGNLGRLDILADYAQLLDDEKTRAHVLRKARWVVERYRREGGFALFVNAPTKVFSPGLFVGSSGIAYALLRLAMPGQLPSVLAYE